MSNPLYIDLTKKETASFIHALEFANVGFLQYDTNDSILYINDFLFQLLELNSTYKYSSDLIGKNIKELYSTLPLKNNIRAILIDKKHIHGIEMNFITRTNQLKSAYIDAHFINYPDSKDSVFQIIVKDNTNQKNSESALRISEEKFSKAFYISPDSININRLSDGLFIEVNQGFLEMAGYTIDEVIGKTSLELNIWDNPSDREKLVSGINEKGEVNSLEAQFKRKDGSVLIGLMSAKLIDINGEACIINITHDITQRKLAEQALITSETKYKAIIELGVDAILLGSPVGMIIGANLQATILTGFSKEELLTFNIRILFTDESVAEHPLRYDLLTQGFIVRTERVIRRKDESFVPIEMNTKMMPDGTYQTFIRDMTERKQAEALAQKILETEQENKIKSQFLANLSHEIRNPLNGIMGLTNTLLKSRLTTDQHQFLEAIYTSSENLLNVLNDVLNYSKIEANKIEIHEEEANLYTVLKNICLVYENKAIEKKIEFSSTFPQNKNINIITDINKLKQIIINLLSNAYKFTSKGSLFIEVEFSNETAHTSILNCTIKDTGIGIKQEDYDKIFKSFTQIDESTAKEYQGTGLGLAISKDYAELLGGSISFESTFGEGSTFYLKIPVKINRAKADELEIKELPIINNNNNSTLKPTKEIHILVADDDGINRMYLTNFLKIHSFKVDEAKNGIEVIEKNKLNQYDIILMDCQMPKLDGFETTKQIRELEKSTNMRVHIIAISGYSFNDLKEKFDTTDFDSYIIKPINETILLDNIIQFIQ